MSKQPTKGSKKSNEEIYAGFQSLRAEQRQIANKISELEMDLNEHKIVIETLSGVEESRRCFRMVGGVLVQRTVRDVLPELRATAQRLPAAVAALNDQLAAAGARLNQYVDANDIRLQRAPHPHAEPPPADTKANVLVSAT